MFETPIVTFEPGEGFSIVGADIFVHQADFAGVLIAAQNLAKDLSKVTGVESQVKSSEYTYEVATTCIIIGTIAQSPLIQALKDAGKLDIVEVDGKWESWKTITVKDPFEGYTDALVIAGSDKRGAIFGTYSLAEQIGVSP